MSGNALTEFFCLKYGEEAYEHIWRAALGEDFPDVTITDREGGSRGDSDKRYKGFIEIGDEIVHFHHYSGSGSGDGLSAFGPDPLKLPSWDD